MSRLTYQEKKRLPASVFALPERRMFPLVDAAHAADAMARLSMSWNLGHLTKTEYERAHRAIRAAEKKFGVDHRAGHAGARKVVQREARVMAHAAAHAGGGARARRGGGGETALSDAAVFAEVDRIKRAHKSAETRARNIYNAETKRIFSFLRENDDVTRAARANALHRAGILLSESLDRAQAKRAKALHDLRRRAGAWADIVPSTY
jgi:hypothetical protein